jgi:very-short-patch-repair endonuclease
VAEYHSAGLIVAWIAASSAATVLGYALWTAWRKRHVGELTFKRRTFLTPNEVDFYGRLVAAVGPDLVVCPQVSMAALVESRLKPTHRLYWQVRATYSGKICDFVLCKPACMTPVLVVELDDRMHNFERDARRDRFLALAGLGTMRFWSAKKPAPPALRELLAQRLPMLRPAASRAGPPAAPARGAKIRRSAQAPAAA